MTTRLVQARHLQTGDVIPAYMPGRAATVTAVKTSFGRTVEVTVEPVDRHHFMPTRRNYPLEREVLVERPDPPGAG